MPNKKFAWYPMIVDTWRSNPNTENKAWIWLQSYYIRDGRKYVLHLGIFHREF